jgi:dTDP-glucose 4,6-dehydratase
VPNEAYNLGSLNPPPVKQAARRPDQACRLEIDPASDARLGGQAATLDCFDCVNMPIMDPEQYLIADEMCILDVSGKAEARAWLEAAIPRRGHADRGLREYRAKKPARLSQHTIADPAQ